MVRAISIDRREPENQSCPAPARRSALDTIVSGTFTAVVSAALFSRSFLQTGCWRGSARWGFFLWPCGRWAARPAAAGGRRPDRRIAHEAELSQ
jgi:hypothetical protein